MEISNNIKQKFEMRLDHLEQRPILLYLCFFCHYYIIVVVVVVQSFPEKMYLSKYGLLTGLIIIFSGIPFEFKTSELETTQLKNRCF